MRSSLSILFFILLIPFYMRGQEAITDSISIEKADSIAQPADMNWWHLLKKGKLDLKNPDVEYPRFLRFCVDVYNWGDRVFNGVDTTYIKGTGRRWKAMIRSDNWLDGYAMDLDGPRVFMLSDVVCNLGFYVSYMAVSVGYQVDMTNIIGNQPINHKKFEFNFNCARFSIDAYYNENWGGTYLRHIDGYDGNRFFKHYVPGVRMINYGVDAYFFLNNRKYSQGAAYNFSRIQLKSAGSWIFGFSASNQDIDLDFADVPENILQALKLRQDKFSFNYNDFSFIVGYGYNWVFAKNWLFNICAMPNIGWKHCLPDCEGGRRDIFSLNIKGRLSFTYNYKDFFASIVGRMDGHWYNSSGYSFFNSVENLVVNLGVRF